MDEMVTLIFVAFIAFGISLVMIINYIMHHLIERDRIIRRNRIRNHRIIPLDYLTSNTLSRLRQTQEQRYVINNHAEVMTELKNKIIVINPDNSMSLGTEN
jgi:heme exporter protein D